MLSVIHESIEHVDARTLFYFLHFQKVRQLGVINTYTRNVYSFTSKRSLNEK